MIHSPGKEPACNGSGALPGDFFRDLFDRGERSM
jgi:hypothetical protein